MNGYFQIFLNTIGKILLITSGYIFGSFIFMLLVMSLISGKFPPPVNELLNQIQMANKHLSAATQSQIISNESTAGDSASDTANLFSFSGLSKTNNYRKELEGLMIGDDLTPSDNKQPTEENDDKRELRRMRFEIDVLNTQMAQIREDLEKLKFHNEKTRK